MGHQGEQDLPAPRSRTGVVIGLAALVVLVAWLVRTPVTDADLAGDVPATDAATDSPPDPSPEATPTPTPTTAPRSSPDLADLPVADGRWTAIPLPDALIQPISPPSAQLVGEDLVVLYGREVRALDIATLTWRDLPELPLEGQGFTGIVVPVDDRAVVLRTTPTPDAGLTLGGRALEEDEASWQAIPALPGGIRALGVVDADLVVIGDPSADGTAPAHRLRVQDEMAWEAMPPVPLPVGGGQVVDADGTTLLLAVAVDDTPPRGRLLQLGDDGWQGRATPPDPAEGATAVTWLPGGGDRGRLVAVGSPFPLPQGRAPLAEYDPSADQWRTADVGPVAEGVFSVVPAGGDRVHLARVLDVVGDVAVVDVTTGAVEVLPPPVAWQGPPTLHPLPDGSLLVTGRTPDTAFTVQRWTPDAP